MPPNRALTVVFELQSTESTGRPGNWRPKRRQMCKEGRENLFTWATHRDTLFRTQMVMDFVAADCCLARGCGVPGGCRE